MLLSEPKSLSSSLCSCEAVLAATLLLHNDKTSSGLLRLTSAGGTAPSSMEAGRPETARVESGKPTTDVQTHLVVGEGAARSCSSRQQTGLQQEHVTAGRRYKAFPCSI